MQKSRKNRTQKRKRRRQQRGGASDFNVPIRSFYPQNQYLVDPQRMAVVGGGRKYSRKYLRKGGAGWGFLGDFGTTSGSLNGATAVTGISQGAANMGSRYMV